MSDLISRADAIETVRKIVPVETAIDATLLDKAEVVVELSALPSVENSNAKTQNSNQETQKSNGDLIYRADAVEAVQDVDTREKVSVSEAVKAINALPKPYRWWIPCSERLPNESGWYVISVVGFENITDVSYFYSDESKWSDVSHTQSVVAWMPLPTPYKGGKEE